MTNRSFNERIEPCPLVKRLTSLYAALASASKSYDAEAVYEAIGALRISRPSSAPSEEMVEAAAKAIADEAARLSRHRHSSDITALQADNFARAAISAISQGR